MPRFGVFALALGLATCGADPPPDGVAGRWDGTVRSEDPYPLWLEIRFEEDGTLAGRIQERFGHALSMENLEAGGDRASWNVGVTQYTASLYGSELRGTAMTEDGAELEWVAVRAPELPAPESPEWGEPVELFNGEDLTGWRPRDPDAPNHWSAEDGVLVNAEAGSDLVTEAEFQDFNLHAEVNVPEGSNSGIYLRGRYEVQVQDDYGKEPHALHMGGIYGQLTPVSNPARTAGEWQSFDITLLGRFVTVVLNGETILDREEIPGTTGGALDADEAEPGPIMLQGDHGRILYRNLVLTPAR